MAKRQFERIKPTDKVVHVSKLHPQIQAMLKQATGMTAQFVDQLKQDPEVINVTVPDMNFIRISRGDLKHLKHLGLAIKSKSSKGV